jgi:hypothetical protein
MGRVSIWAQWLIIASGVLFSPLFVLFMAGVIGGSLFRKPWRAAGREPHPRCEQGCVAAPPFGPARTGCRPPPCLIATTPSVSEQ